jgi:hypothetical protein
MSQLVAPNGRAAPYDECQLPGVERKWLGARQTDAIDRDRTHPIDC